MNNPVAADLFVEDRAQEEFLKAMVKRIAVEEHKEIRLNVITARGGPGRALRELELYQRSVQGGLRQLPNLLLVAIDSNCSSYAGKRAAIEQVMEAEFRGRTILACPDPHIEKWYLADPPSFHVTVGSQPSLGKKKCERGRYKTILS
jgi:hypothetical protein